MKVNHLNKIALAIAFTIPLAGCGSNSSNTPSNNNHTVAINASLQPTSIKIGETSLFTVNASATNPKDLTDEECTSAKLKFSDTGIASKSQTGESSSDYEYKNGKATCKTTITLMGNKTGNTDVTLSYGDNSSKPQKLTVTDPNPKKPLPTGDNHTKYSVYMMTQDLGSNVASSTIKSSTSNQLALFPNGYKSGESTAKLQQQCGTDTSANTIDKENNAFCKVYLTKKALNNDNVDVELNLSFEKPHTGKENSKLSTTPFSKSMTMKEFNTLSGFSFPEKISVANVLDFIKQLEASKVYIFNSVGGWNYSNPVIDTKGTADPMLTGDHNCKLIDVYHAALKIDTPTDKTVPNKYTEVEWAEDGSSKNIDDPTSTCAARVAEFDYFPSPRTKDSAIFDNIKYQSIPNPENNQDDKDNGKRYIQNWVDLANFMGVNGIDLDYEETWNADVNSETSPYTTTSSYISPRSAAKYSAILGEIAADIKTNNSSNKHLLSLSMATVPVAADPIDATTGDQGNQWWLGNLKGLAYMAAKDGTDNVKTALGMMDHIGLMDYDVDTDLASGNCATIDGYGASAGATPSGAAQCDLVTQAHGYLAHWKRFLDQIKVSTPVLGGVELGQPAYPQPFTEGKKKTDTNCNIPLVGILGGQCGGEGKNSLNDAKNIDNILSVIMSSTPDNTNTKNGAIVWELNKGFTYGTVNDIKYGGGDDGLWLELKNNTDRHVVASYGDLVTQAAKDVKVDS